MRSRSRVVGALLVAGCGSKPAPAPVVVVVPPSPMAAAEAPPGSTERSIANELFLEVEGEGLELRFEAGCGKAPSFPSVTLTTWADDPHLLFCASAGDSNSAWIYLAGRMGGVGTSYGGRVQFEHPESGETYFTANEGGVSIEVTSFRDVGAITEGSYAADLTTYSVDPAPESTLSITGRFRVQRTPDETTVVP